MFSAGRGGLSRELALLRGGAFWGLRPSWLPGCARPGRRGGVAPCARSGLGGRDILWRFPHEGLALGSVAAALLGMKKFDTT